MIILYDEHGRKCEFVYPVDANQALQSGLYFTEHPGKAKENKHFKVEKKEPEKEVVVEKEEKTDEDIETSFRTRKTKIKDRY